MNEICKKHVDSCRFCWMCRHICPIGNATGLERDTARARALGLSLVNRGVFDISEVSDNLYECACCGACSKDCATGWDPVLFTKAARLDAALAGKLPPYIETAVKNCLETGNAYGKTGLEKDLAGAISRHAEKTDTLLFLGVDARYMAQKSAVSAILALEKAGLSFTVLADEPASGAQLEYLIGAADETKRTVTACAGVLHGFARVIAYDPQDALIFRRVFGEWGIRCAAETVTFTSELAQLLRDGKLKAVNTGKRAAYQDPFQLSRDLCETEEPRQIVAAYCVPTEMLLNRKDTMWAGNILMAQWMPEVIRKVSENRIANAVNMGAEAIVCASVSEYTALENVEQREVKILSLEQLVLGAE